VTLTPSITLPAQQVTPLVKHKIVKKRTAKFKRFQSDRKVTVKVRVESGKPTSGRRDPERICALLCPQREYSVG